MILWTWLPTLERGKPINDYRSQVRSPLIVSLVSRPPQVSPHSIPSGTWLHHLSHRERGPTAPTAPSTSQTNAECFLCAKDCTGMFSSLFPMLTTTLKEATILLLLLQSPILFKLHIWPDLYFQHHSLNPNHTELLTVSYSCLVVLSWWFFLVAFPPTGMFSCLPCTMFLKLISNTPPPQCLLMPQSKIVFFLHITDIFLDHLYGTSTWFCLLCSAAEHHGIRACAWH